MRQRVNPLTALLWLSLGELEEEHLKLESGALAMDCLHWTALLLNEIQDIQELKELRLNILSTLPSIFLIFEAYLWDRKNSIQDLAKRIRTELTRIEGLIQEKEEPKEEA